MKETWKVFPRFPDYEISNLGNRRVKDGVDKKLWKHKKFDGTTIWLFTKNETILDTTNRQVFPPHQVVAELFLAEVDGLDDVKHIDFNIDNNRADNLERCLINDTQISYSVFPKKLKEKWRVIKEHPNYAVSNIGRVMNKVKGNILRPSLNTRYYKVSLDNKTFNVHRLMAKEFLPRIKGKDIVNHKDGVRTNNMLTNIEWSDVKDNTNHATNTGLLKQIGEDNSVSKLTNKDVKEICELLMDLNNTVASIGKKYKVTTEAIRSIYSRRSWYHLTKNYKFPNRDQTLLTANMVTEISELLMVNKMTNKSIGKLFGVAEQTIQGIHNGRKWVHITKDYSFPKRSCIILTNKDTIEICGLLMENKMIYKEIGKIYKVNPATIRDIHNGNTWKHITKNYEFPKRRNTLYTRYL